jgi:hypothetical protein
MVLFHKNSVYFRDVYTGLYEIMEWRKCSDGDLSIRDFMELFATGQDVKISDLQRHFKLQSSESVDEALKASPQYHGYCGWAAKMGAVKAMMHIKGIDGTVYAAFRQRIAMKLASDLGVARNGIIHRLIGTFWQKGTGKRGVASVAPGPITTGAIYWRWQPMHSSAVQWTARSSSS